MSNRIGLAAAAIAVFSFGLVGESAAQVKNSSKPLGTIERKDPRFDALVPKDAKLMVVAEGFDWAEGPVWVPRQGCLLFSDVPRNIVYQFREGRGVEEYLAPSGYTGKVPRGGEPGSNGLILDPLQRLVLCQHGDRRVARYEESSKRFITLVDRYKGKRLNSPNDGVYKSNGDLYFTDPSYGLVKGNADPDKELRFNGVYRLTYGGELTLLTDEMTFPNGIAFSPDEKTLYVANSDPKKAIWMAYDVQPNGSIKNGRVFFDATPWANEGKLGLPDGMKVDSKGNLFATGPGGVIVFAPDGTHLGTFNTGVATANCGWAEDGHVLYVTADMYLCRIPLTTKGKGY